MTQLDDFERSILLDIAAHRKTDLESVAQRIIKNEGSSEHAGIPIDATMIRNYCNTFGNWVKVNNDGNVEITGDGIIEATAHNRMKEAEEERDRREKSEIRQKKISAIRGKIVKGVLWAAGIIAAYYLTWLLSLTLPTSRPS